MRTMSHLFCAAAAMPLLALAAAGHTSFASYINQVPAPPRTAEEAYRTVLIDRNAGPQDPVKPPPAFAQLEQKLEAEARLAASEAGSGAAMGITDEASARALAQQMQGMSQAQQMAMAQQMAAQMNGSMQAGALGPGDQAVMDLLGKRQQGSMARMTAASRIDEEWSAQTSVWDQAHADIAAEEYAALERTQPQCSKTDDMDFAALKVHEQYAEKHLARVREELKAALGLYERRRVLAVDDAGFADQLAPRMKQAKSPPARQGYGAARQDAIRQVSSLSGMSWKMHEHAALWWRNKLDTSPARRCTGAK